MLDVNRAGVTSVVWCSGFRLDFSWVKRNATGFTSYEYGFGAKWLELLKEIVPSVKRAAVLRNADESAGIAQFAGIQGVASALGVELSPIGMRDAEEIERAVTAFARSPNGGLIVTGSAPRSYSPESDRQAGGPPQATRGVLRTFLRYRGRVDLLWPRSGRSAPARGLLRRRILKGEKPADLPVQAPTKYEFSEPTTCERRRS